MKIQDFTIADVAAANGLEVINPSKGTCVCPFCGDRRGKFAYAVDTGRGKENVFNCFKCGAKGNHFELHKLLNPNPEFLGPDGGRAIARDIRRLMGKEEFESQRGDFVSKAPVYQEAERASDAAINRFYQHMLMACTLERRHKEDLLKRGLTEAQIEEFGFRSVPRDTRGLMRYLVKKKGLNPEGVPGTYINKWGDWDLAVPKKPREEGGGYAPKGGYFCLQKDLERHLIGGMQIRLDDPGDGAKYVWLSSAGRNKGTGSGAQTTFLEGEEDRCVIVTEGILKAAVIWHLLDKRVSVAGLPGVTIQKGLAPYLDRCGSNAFAFAAFDMDRYENPKVMEAQGKLCALIRSYGIGVHELKWGMKDGGWDGKDKGLDDFLLGYRDRKKFADWLIAKTNEDLALKAIIL